MGSREKKSQVCHSKRLRFSVPLFEKEGPGEICSKSNQMSNRWPLVMPLGILLIRVTRAQNRQLVEGLAYELQCDGQFAVREAAGHRQRRQAGQIKWPVILRHDMLEQRINRTHVLDQ